MPHDLTDVLVEVDEGWEWNGESVGGIDGDFDRALAEGPGGYGFDEEMGDVEGPGFYGLLIDVAVLEEEEDEPTVESFIVSQDSQGFWNSESFATEGAARRRWADLEEVIEEAQGPGEEDVTADSPDGPFFYLRKKVAEDQDELREWMEREQYYPNVWWISDHGNAHRVTLDEGGDDA